MKKVPPLWVYKCNSKQHAYQIAWGDWRDFFAFPHPAEWGGNTTMGNARSLDILWNRMQEGDLILCWQTDRKRAEGLCRVASLEDSFDEEGEPQRDMWLELVGEPFSPPVKILELKRTDPKIAGIRAFTSGLMGTLYGTTGAEARDLLRVCGVSPVTLERLLRPPNRRGAGKGGGGGFGSPEENRKVEQAAVRVIRAAYRRDGWEMVDRQKDNVGYDFDAYRSGVSLHIEVKGARGPMASFPITHHEVAVAGDDPFWQVSVVTGALSGRPRIWEWSAEQFLKEFELSPLGYMAKRKSG